MLGLAVAGAELKVGTEGVDRGGRGVPGEEQPVLPKGVMAMLNCRGR